ncbi:MAG: 50S ribosomal protein L10 [bacterium]|nr:50S ribosomal protein L10 [bacterium]
MPLTRDEKTKIVSDAVGILKQAHMVIFADYKGMSVAKSQMFRRKVKKEGGSYKVIKKTLARIALKEAGLPAEGLEKYKDTLAVVTHKTEDSQLAKLFTQVTKELPELQVAGGIFEGKTLSKADVLELAKLPSKEEMLAKLLGTFMAPMSSFVRVLNGPVSGFTTIINKLATK